MKNSKNKSLEMKIECLTSNVFMKICCAIDSFESLVFLFSLKGLYTLKGRYFVFKSFELFWLYFSNNPHSFLLKKLLNIRNFNALI